MTGKSLAHNAVVAGLVASLLTGTALADPQLPLQGPLPAARAASSAAGIAIDPARFGSSEPVRLNPVAPRAAPAPVSADTSSFTASIASVAPRAGDLRPIAGHLREGLDALSKHEVRKARAIREGMAPGSLDRQILAWAIALNGGGDVPAQEIARATAELSGWPGMKTLRANTERALYREKLGAREVVSVFAGSQPETPEGAMALARAQLEIGEAGKAKALISRVWRERDLDRSTETRLIEQFGPLLSRADHKYRLDRLLYAERIGDAERVAKLAGARELLAASAAAARGEKGAGTLLSAVPDKSDPAYLFARVKHLRKSGKSAEAADVLLKAPRDRAALVNPDAWWNERRIVARDLLDLGQAKAAYKIVSAHSAESPSEAADAEFHAGWIALRFLNDPKTAHSHFARIAEASKRPLSASRSMYWLGRAAEAGGPGQAAGYYAKAAQFNTTFYGQLAAARIGRRPGDIVYPTPSGAERQRFESRGAVQAIRRLEAIDYVSRANILYRELADELNSPGELALLAAMAERRGNHYLALRVGKLASWRGVDAPALAFPVGVIPSSANISASGKALAYAIARQESEFNPAAKSPAGALGLLQLMPNTARTVAGKAGMPYSVSRLTTDAGYNATLGSRFLGEQISDFGGSYVLTFVAYNAGPRRAREWIQRFGDPRGKSIEEVVDWVERIPFTETRNYVQRVMENYQVYKIRLGAEFSIDQDLRVGRRS